MTCPHLSMAPDNLPAGVDAFIALGSNIGDKAENIARAVTLLTQNGEVRLVSRSDDFKTPPWGNVDQDWFVNACIGVKTELPARVLLDKCQAVERQMGRTREERWGPRLIDLDILVHGSRVIDEPGLTVPHPQLTVRKFVLEPLAQIAPEMRIGAKTVAQWLEKLCQDSVATNERPD